MRIFGTGQPLNWLRVAFRGFASSGRVNVTLKKWMNYASILHRFFREGKQQAIKAVGVTLVGDSGFPALSVNDTLPAFSADLRNWMDCKQDTVRRSATITAVSSSPWALWMVFADEPVRRDKEASNHGGISLQRQRPELVVSSFPGL